MRQVLIYSRKEKGITNNSDKVSVSSFTDEKDIAFTAFSADTAKLVLAISGAFQRKRPVSLCDVVRPL